MVEKLKKGSELPVASVFGLDDTVFGIQENVTKRFPGSALQQRVLQDSINQILFSQAEQYAAGSLGAYVTGRVSPQDSPWLAKGDGVTDDTAAIQQCVTDMTGLGKTIWLDRDYKVSSVSGVRITGSTVIDGPGQLVYDNYASTSNHKPAFYTDAAIPAGSILSIQGIAITGNWGQVTDFTEANSLVSCYNFSKFIFKGVRAKGSRSGGIVVGNADFTFVAGCEFEACYRDALRIANSVRTIVAQNFFKDICDDAIAVTNTDTNPMIQTSSIITGNHLVDSQGIAALGAKVTNIGNNLIYRPIHRGIITGQAENTFAEGHTAGLATNIWGNTILDGFHGTAFSPLSGSGFNAIHISGKPMLAKDTVGSAVSGSVIKPYPYLYTKATDGTGVVNAGMQNLKVHNNIVARTLAPTTQYSLYGFGTRLSRSGRVDPAVTLAQMMDSGIYMTGGGSDCSFCDNQIDGCKNGINLNLRVAAVGVSARNFEVKRNTVRNWKDFGVLANANGHIAVEDNILDGDPWLESPLRGINGSWGSSFASHAGIYFQQAATLLNPVLTGTLMRNTFRNVGIPFNQGGGENYASVLRKDNVLICDPAATGYSVSNKGIGFVPKADNLDAMLVVEDSDPSSSTFGKTLNVCLTASASRPVSGKYLAGLRTRCTNGSKTIEWIRATNGSTHTDADYITITGA